MSYGCNKCIECVHLVDDKAGYPDGCVFRFPASSPTECRLFKNIPIETIRQNIKDAGIDMTIPHRRLLALLRQHKDASKHPDWDLDAESMNIE